MDEGYRILIYLIMSGLFQWLSRLYRNGGSLLFAPPRLDWGEQVVVVTGGAYTWVISERTHVHKYFRRVRYRRTHRKYPRSPECDGRGSRREAYRDREL